MTGAADRPLFERLVHDLKGPLSPLQTAAYLLRRQDLPPERRMELAETIERQSRRMAAMIEELGDWVRANEGRLVSRRRPVDVQMLVDLVVGGAAGCASVPEVDPDVATACLDGDEPRLVQALAALLAHAQARDPAPPMVHAMRVGDRAVFEIADRGPDPDTPDRLLEDPLPEPFDLGLGLRLVVATAIIRAHGGQIAAHALSPGLAYRVELPIAEG